VRRPGGGLLDDPPAAQVNARQLRTDRILDEAREDADPST
jgi:hypothetical protein